ncbi:MAG: 4'-phosphopantetheinyl transferase superfamily protein, partial [Comamonas sp.]
IALCPGARVGIDVTEIAPMPDWAAVAKSYLGPAALARLAPADGAARDKAFALAWAELEARGKCLGLGLQEWSAARHARLQAPAIEVITGVLDGLASGPSCAFALARNANRTQL